MISKNTRRAYAEVYAFLNILDDEHRNRIPEKMRYIFERERDNSYIKEIRIDVPIEEQNLMKETLAIIALLNLYYWCENESEKNELFEAYKRNSEGL